MGKKARERHASLENKIDVLEAKISAFQGDIQKQMQEVSFRSDHRFEWVGEKFDVFFANNEATVEQIAGLNRMMGEMRARLEEGWVPRQRARRTTEAPDTIDNPPTPEPPHVMKTVRGNAVLDARGTPDEVGEYLMHWQPELNTWMKPALPSVPVGGTAAFRAVGVTVPSAEGPVDAVWVSFADMVDDLLAVSTKRISRQIKMYLWLPEDMKSQVVAPGAYAPEAPVSVPELVKEEVNAEGP